MPTTAYDYWDARYGAYAGAFRHRADAQFSIPAVLLYRGYAAPPCRIVRDRVKADWMWRCLSDGWGLSVRCGSTPLYPKSSQPSSPALQHRPHDHSPCGITVTAKRGDGLGETTSWPPSMRSPGSHSTAT